MRFHGASQVIDDFKAVGITVFLALVKANVQKHLVRGGFYEKFDKQHVFLTIHDAVLATLRDHPALLMELILDAPVFPITAIRSVTNSSSNLMLRTRALLILHYLKRKLWCRLHNHLNLFKTPINL